MGNSCCKTADNVPAQVIYDVSGTRTDEDLSVAISRLAAEPTVEESSDRTTNDLLVTPICHQPAIPMAEELSGRTVHDLSLIPTHDLTLKPAGDRLDFKEGKWEKEYKKEVEKHVKKHGVHGIEELLMANLKRWEDVEINFGITGDSGVGKSSFINAVRGTKDDDKDAAETGVTETTTEPKGYRHPRNKNIVFWDLPGIGTPNFSELKKYCDEVGLKEYDILLILTSKRFTENNRLLAEEVKSFKKSFFFVRTHVDENYRAESRKDNFDEKKMLDKIRGDCLKNLKNLKVEDEEVFLISNNDPDKWDFPRLIKAIEDDLPLSQKESLMLSLTTLSKELVVEKAQILRGRIWRIAGVSCFGAVIPVSGISIALDAALLTRELDSYKSQLGLPEETSKFFNRLTPEMKETIRKYCISGVTEIRNLLAPYCASATAEEIARYVPILGSAIAGGISFASTYYFLHASLNELEQTAMDFLDEIKAKAPGQC